MRPLALTLCFQRPKRWIRRYNDGIKEGILERNKEIIKQMLKYNMSIENIIKITNLSKKEIESLI